MLRPLPAFCSNLLAEESLQALFPALANFACGVRAAAGVDRLGIDLRLGLEAIAEGRDLALCHEWRQRFADQGLAVTSLNAFPLLPFQSAVVKDNAYRPDWGDPKRLQATTEAIAIADALCAEDQELCTISTLPGSYLPWGTAAASSKIMAQQLGYWVAAAIQHREQGGRRVVLSIEPEPCCSWGSGAALASFWTSMGEQVSAAAASRCAGISQESVLEHLAVCWDTCHASVVFEEQAATIGALSDVGLKPLKVQYSAAPACDDHPSLAAIEALCAMAEPRFCHQVGIRHGDHTTILNDLPDLAIELASWRTGRSPLPDAIRTHFHIPVHQQPDSQLLSSTVDDSNRGLMAALDHGARHVSVETYTWSLRHGQGHDPVAGTAAEIRQLAQLLDAHCPK